MERMSEAILRWFNDLEVHGLFTTDTELRIVTWNRWLELHTGRTAGELIGRNLLDAWPELGKRGFGPYYRDALGGQVQVIAQALHGHLLPMRARWGHRAMPIMPQTARIAPLTEGDEVIGTITIIEDVTERTIRETELRSQIDLLDECRTSGGTVSSRYRRMARVVQRPSSSPTASLGSGVVASSGPAFTGIDRQKARTTRLDHLTISAPPTTVGIRTGSPFQRGDTS